MLYNVCGGFENNWGMAHSQTLNKNFNPCVRELDRDEVYEKIRKGLPSKISDDAVRYLTRKLLKNGNRNVETGQVFDYRTGEEVSIVFRGGFDSVVIQDFGPSFKPKFMNNEKYGRLSFLDEESYYKDLSNTLATQHVHVSGISPPSYDDFILAHDHYWSDYTITLCNTGVWVIDSNPMSVIELSTLERDFMHIVSKSQKHVQDMYPDKEDFKKRVLEMNRFYGDEVEKYINNKNDNISIIGRVNL